ncbi:MAG: FKBP-type peptidyl-prolyl cis-trans isomerase, partial [Phycisphaerales bacterium]|nr:FKBP-type peptidyl-prolyl cis-trans isomerase [Phycisphaerales bacterium]
ENLNGDIIRNAFILNQPTDELKLGAGGRWETHLNLFEPATNQCIEHLQLLGNVHRLSQGLIAISQIHTTPLRSLLQRTVGPLPVRQMNGGKRTVLTNW